MSVKVYDADMARHTIHKSAGILIQDKKLLVVRSRGKDFFMSPGGKIEPGETPEGALVRELKEELNISVSPTTLTLFGSYTAPATGQTDTMLHMDVYMVTSWNGDILASHEIEELLWVSSDNANSVQISSIFAHEVIPALIARGLIA
jgi:mutator protein MutT